jgi:type VI secretion system VasD/TssJ family lipoprotein
MRKRTAARSFLIPLGGRPTYVVGLGCSKDSLKNMLRRRLLLSINATAVAAVWAPLRLACAQTPAAPKRLALVIGNARYPEVPLNNPVNDARLMVSTLRELGFDVTRGEDLTRADFVQALIDFSRQIPAGADVVFYYAGHAVQIRGNNFLLPVDIKNLGDSDWVEQNAINLDSTVVRQLSQREGAGVRLLFIDACRDNPYGTTRARAPKLTAGLASVQASASIASDVLIATASLPNQPAEDGPPDGNSVYTRNLARELRVPGQDVAVVLRKVAAQVIKDTREAQTPMAAGSLVSEFIFNTGHTATAGGVQRVQAARGAQIAVSTDPAMNPGANGRPRRCVMLVFVLRRPEAFQRATFEALTERAESILAADLLARPEKHYLAPGKSFPLALDMSSAAGALGVVVGFEQLGDGGWRAVLPLPAQANLNPSAPLPIRIDVGVRTVRIALAG